MSTTAGQQPHFLQRLGLFDATMLVAGSMIGSGIYIVSADIALNLPDQRATERTYQLLTQAIGRAGRGDKPGIAIVQTYLPDHPVIAALGDDLAQFHKWMTVSVALVGHAHLGLAAHGFRFARAFHRKPSDGLIPLTLVDSWVGGFAVAVITSAVPGIVLYAIPPVLTLMTGIAFIPLAYFVVHKTAKRERATLKQALNPSRPPVLPVTPS